MEKVHYELGSEYNPYTYQEYTTMFGQAGQWHGGWVINNRIGAYSNISIEGEIVSNAGTRQSPISMDVYEALRGYDKWIGGYVYYVINQETGTTRLKYVYANGTVSDPIDEGSGCGCGCETGSGSSSGDAGYVRTGSTSLTSGILHAFIRVSWEEGYVSENGTEGPQIYVSPSYISACWHSRYTIKLWRGNLVDYCAVPHQYIGV